MKKNIMDILLKACFSILFFCIFGILMDCFFDLFSTKETYLINMIHVAIVMVVGIPVSIDLARILVRRQPKFSAIALASIIFIIAVYLTISYSSRIFHSPVGLSKTDIDYRSMSITKTDTVVSAYDYPKLMPLFEQYS